MRPYDDEIRVGFLGDRQNLGVDARTMCHENFGMQVRGIDPADQADELVFQVLCDQVVGKRRALGLKDGLDLAYHCQDMKLSPELAREFHCREERSATGSFVIEVNGNQDVFVQVRLLSLVASN